MTKGKGVLPIGVGLAVGLAIGAGMHNIALGIPIGVALSAGWLFAARPKPPAEAKEDK